MVLLTLPVMAMDLVKQGQPVAQIIVGDSLPPPAVRGAPPWSDRYAAKVLADWIEKIADVRLVITNVPARGRPAIFVGQAAVAQGLQLDDIDSPSGEGLRIAVKGDTALIGGQNAESTVRAACRFLEQLGCRYFMDSSACKTNPSLGEVFPRTRDLSVEAFTHAEKPGLLARTFWGSAYYKPTLWRVWNGDGGLAMNTGHSWAGYVPQAEYGEKHPEYFALRDGKRDINVEWLCTSNSEVRELFVRKLLSQASENPKGSFSISPPDNRLFCECERCRAQDDPEHREASSGAISMSARFVDFYNDIGRRVHAKYPEVTLNFYAYSDYTEPPRERKKAAPNLVAWVTPIRYSRYHRINSPLSPSKRFEAGVIEGWSRVVDKLAYRTYNFNLAESTVPFSKLLTWKHDIPYLKEKGFVGINNESFVAWALNGPHLYQSLRLMYDPDLDSDALMNDYFARFYGTQAGVPMKQYWMCIDQAFQNLPSEAGCFFAVHLVYTPARLALLQGLLDEAAKYAGGDASYAARVALANEGLKMSWDYMKFRDRLNRGDPVGAKETADRMLQRARDNPFAFHNKSVEYIRRFITRIGDPAAATCAPPNRLLQVLPDEWLMRADPGEAGVGLGWQSRDLETWDWHPVRTYSASLSEQGFADRPAFQWYRTTFAAPAQFERLMLFFCDIDGAPETSRLFINGKEIKSDDHDCAFEPNRKDNGWRRREPVWSFIERAVEPGKTNTVALLLDHRNLSENALGGIVRPVYLVAVPAGNGS